MTLARAQHKNNIVIGAGEFFIDILDDDGNPQGERYVGDTVGGTLDIQTETTTVYSGDGPTSDLLEEIVTQVRRSIQITMHDIQAPNLALFVTGEADSQADKAVEVKGEEITVKQGRWYPLGRSKDKPAGVVAVAAGVKVYDTADKAKAGTANSDTYTSKVVIDAASGRLYVKADGDAPIADDSKIYVTYTPVAQEVAVVKASKQRVVAAIRYIEAGETGKGNDYYAPRCNVGAAGSMALKSRDNEEQLQITCSVLEPTETGVPPLYINGQKA